MAEIVPRILHTADAGSFPSSAETRVPCLAGSALQLESDFQSVRSIATATLGNEQRGALYVGTRRYEYQRDDRGEVQAFARIDDSSRNWRSELIDIRRELELTRRMLLSDAVIEHLSQQIEVLTSPGKRMIALRELATFREELHGSIDGSDERQILFEYDIKDRLRRFPSLNSDPGYTSLLARENALRNLAIGIQELTENSPEVMQDIFRKRLDLQAAIARNAEQIAPQRIHFYLDDESTGSGILGTAQAIARSLKAYAPQLDVHIFGILNAEGSHLYFPEGVRDGVTFHLLEEGEVSPEIIAGASLHITTFGLPEMRDQASATGGQVTQMLCVPGSNLRPGPDEINWGMETDSTYYSLIFSSYLQDPYGTMALDESLRRQARIDDEQTPEQRIESREAWLERNSSPALRKLADSAAADGWDCRIATWSLAYVADSRSFANEMVNLAGALERGALKDQDLRRESSNVVIFCARNRYQTPESHHEELRQHGIGIIDQDGVFHRPQHTLAHGSITLVLTDGFANTEMRHFMSALSGTLDYDSDGQQIQFPLYLTGNASWFEGISAGRISRHDNYDRAPNAFEPALRYLGFRLGSIEGGGAESLERIQRRFVSSHLMGQSGGEASYFNLAGWTREARRESELMHSYSSALDTLAVLKTR